MGENFGEFGELVGNRQNFLAQNFPLKTFLPKIRFIILWHTREIGTLFEMAGLLQYFKLKKQKDSLPAPLPDPNGPLSEKIPSSGIASANACGRIAASINSSFPNRFVIMITADHCLN